MKLKDIHNVFFVGIGGIGMSALARYFNYLGKQVVGYDRVESPITKELQAHGVAVHFQDDLELIPESFKSKNETLVVYTPAVPDTHSQLQYFRKNGFEIKKRAEVLGIITRDTFCFAVAGTHGKTTTSCILAHLLKECGIPITAFLGGISENFNSNFLLEGTEYSVVEADEFDRSFLQLSPDVACITSMDADHLDIYGNPKELTKAFEDFSKKIKPEGTLFVKNGLPLEGITFGIEDDSQYRIENITIEHGTYIFDLISPKGRLEKTRFNQPGRHNLLNGLVAFAMAVHAGCPLHRLAGAMETFKGVQRRFSYQIKEEDLVFIDDYAHHPTEINAVFDAVSEMYPSDEVTAVFQPHLFSRTKDFADDFARSLEKFTVVLLLDIYPAREEPIDGVTSEWLLKKINNPNKKLVDKSNLIQELKKIDTKILVTMGAGDIGLEVSKIKEELAYAS
ncbi:UDP-N-acetylmuramate--L-alanine ligase [Flagellimonas sp. S174]|uniref:UDP-N-acetylmuramate--L-alanine ligase n=1 Tax=Flagellimonas sp. S174 TaxID=3410790 RepID=UPI003BF4A95F